MAIGLKLKLCLVFFIFSTIFLFKECASTPIEDESHQETDDQSSDDILEEYKTKDDVPKIEVETTNPEEWKFHLLTFYELVMMGFLGFYILACMIGKSQNDSLATRWFIANREYFIKNYAHIGTGNNYDSDSSVLKESYNNFKYYASGRKNLNWTLASLDLIKRQDLVSLITSFFVSNEKDRIIFEISINSPSIPHVFSICRKKDIKYMKKTYYDIDFMTNLYTQELVSKSLVFMTEDDEVSDKLFSDRYLRSLYDKVEPFIDIIYFTDRKTFTKESHMLFCSFNVSSMKNSLIITEFVHVLADKLHNLEFNSSKLKSCEKLRSDYEAYVEKEILSKQKENEETKEKEKKQPSKKVPLTREQAIKQEEKEKKERLKKQKQRMMKVVK